MSVQDNWQKWYDALPLRGKIRYKIYHKIDRLTDKLLDYDWVPEWIFSENIQKIECFLCQYHSWEVLWRGYVHKDEEACVYCGNKRSL